MELQPVDKPIRINSAGQSTLDKRAASSGLENGHNDSEAFAAASVIVEAFQRYSCGSCDEH